MGVPDLNHPIAKSKTLVRNYFAHRMVYPWELPSIMRKHIYTGAMGNMYFTLITGIFFVYYGNTVGMTPFQWGLMGAVSSWLLMAQIFTAIATERMGARKLLWFSTAIAGRVVRLAGIFASVYLWHAGARHPELALIAGVWLANFFDAMAAPPWLSWLADIIPSRDHGGFWGRRSAWIAFSVVCVLVPAGFLMDRVPEAEKTVVAIVIFGCAGFIGLVDLVVHGTLPEPELEAAPPRPVRERMMAPLRDAAFRPWLRFNVAWTFSMTLGGSLSTLYFLDQLGISGNFLGGTIVLTVFSLLGGVLTGAWSGRLVDRVGPKRVLFWGHFAWATLPLYWVIATPATALAWLAWSSVFGGAGSTAAVTAANKLITRLPKAPDRAMYAAVSSCLGNIAGGFGVLTAGTFLKVMGDWHADIHGKSVSAFLFLFVASFSLRMLTFATLLGPITDPVTEEAEIAAVEEGGAAEAAAD